MKLIKGLTNIFLIMVVLTSVSCSAKLSSPSSTVDNNDETKLDVGSVSGTVSNIAQTANIRSEPLSSVDATSTPETGQKKIPPPTSLNSPITASLPTNRAPDRLEPNTPSPTVTPISTVVRSSTNADTAEQTPLSPGNISANRPSDTVPNLNILTLPLQWQFLSPVYTKYVNVFGVHLFATENTSQSKILHASSILAEYLDNDENGVPDNPEVVKVLVDSNASVVMFATEEDAEVAEHLLPEKYHDMLDRGELRTQDLHAEETNPRISDGGFDASLEEILHLITSVGYSQMYPEYFGENATSQISNHMDSARGGHFEETSSEDCEDDGPSEDWQSGQCAMPPLGQYARDAWYSYEDTTCDYACMITEYFYWSLTSLLGAHNGDQRCNEIEPEWDLCTAKEVKLKDPAIYNLLTDPKFALPKILPDGIYNPMP